MMHGTPWNLSMKRKSLALLPQAVRMMKRYATLGIQYIQITKAKAMPVKLLDKLGFMKTRSLEAGFCNDAQGNPVSFLASAYERLYK